MIAVTCSFFGFNFCALLCSSCLEKVINLTREALHNTAWPCCSCPVTIRGKMWLRSPHISWVGCICRFPPFFRSLASPSALYGSPGMNASRFQLHCDFIYISALRQGRHTCTHACTFLSQPLMQDLGNQVNWYQAVWFIVDIAGLCLFSVAWPFTAFLN